VSEPEHINYEKAEEPTLKTNNKLTWSFALSVLALVAFIRADAYAKTYNTSSTVTSTSVQVPVDLDGSGNDAVLSNNHGTVSGGPEKVIIDGQSVTQTEPASGTGCVFAPNTIQGCTIGSVTDGCLYNYTGGDSVLRDTSTSDLAILHLASGSLCINLDTPLPWSFVGTETWTTTGGTGGFANASGTSTETFQGQILENDGQGHGLSWSSATSQGTLTVP
jgi:hypothetical protein